MTPQIANIEKTTDEKIVVRVDNRTLVFDSISDAIVHLIVPEFLNSDKKVFELFFQINKIK